MRFTAEVLARYVRAMDPREVLMAFAHEDGWLTTPLFEISAEVGGNLCEVTFSARVPHGWPELGSDVQVVVTNESGDHLTNVGISDAYIAPGSYAYVTFPITMHADTEDEAA